MRTNRKPKFLIPEILWRLHNADTVRVWREDWYGDTFELVGKDDFELKIRPMLKHLGFTVEEADEE